MNARHRFRCIILALLATCLVGTAMAGSVRNGEVTIYYNALTGAALPLVSTQAYRLRHDANQGLVVITANRGSSNLEVQVSGTARTLLGNKIKLQFRAVGKPGQHSTLVIFDVHGHQTINFQLDVTPLGGETTHLRFTHQYQP